MSRRDDTVPLRHMLDHAREAVALVQGRTRADLDSDRTVTLALTRLVEIVGEAANRVSDATQRQHASLPRREIIGMRNRIIHGYDSVDLNILWDVIEGDLPPLIEDLTAILGPGR
jgi:uncharacterized protein with HEPN domain